MPVHTERRENVFYRFDLLSEFYEVDLVLGLEQSHREDCTTFLYYLSRFLYIDIDCGFTTSMSKAYNDIRTPTAPELIPMLS
ncbi:hypothetical protein IscW_ISCW003869 [Ixodes scapularis]|uniref:Uncharacterized protein n=1 Tax=Ixodes scapularis TaxID=6945 RepID=B7PJZ3_IXOSC|nr:hypothetical protein IscW_ISCW003869 [Ixodes scapularis]|eukprot:XP_002408923.1 hypothetical protein IscW_ISCW003869 [Ixodes scapularis]